MNIATCHFKEDLSWLENSQYPVHVIGKEGGDTDKLNQEKFSSINIVPNFANEAGSYLWYIVNNYHSLPDKVAFIHGHENSPHQRMPIFHAIEKFKNNEFVDINRFINFYVLIIPNSFYDNVWQGLLGSFFGKTPKLVRCRGMAQFIVSKKLIQSRPIDFWSFLYQETLRMCKEHPELSTAIGHFYETFWHIIFGADSPIEDQSRPNLVNIDSKLINLQKDPEEDYVDLFIDSECKIYSPWEFMQALI